MVTFALSPQQKRMDIGLNFMMVSQTKRWTSNARVGFYAAQSRMLIEYS
jgi:hypothetical protein